MSEQEPSPGAEGGGDIYSKTLALLRRLLVGNGYKLEDIQIHQLDSQDYFLVGKLALELEVSQQMQKLMGPARGGEMKVFRDRTEEQSYLGSVRDNLGQEDWVDEIRGLVDKLPNQGWAMKEASWPMPKLGQRVALQMICDLCLGNRMENCLVCHGSREIMCQGCSGGGLINCQTCYGSGADPNDRSRPCGRCGGRRQIPCPQCQGRQRIQCHTCRGAGKTECRECQGHGFKTEETTIVVKAHGRFVMGDAAGAPTGVSDLVERVGPEGLTRGHALIRPDPGATMATGENAVYYRATIPHGRFRLELKGQPPHTITVVGMKPVLFDFPSLLDDQLQPAYEQLSSVSLMSLSRKYRLIRELSEAMARGVRPGAFFSQRYPYGLTADFAFALAAKLKDVFSGVSLVPRVITGLGGWVTALGIYYVWLSNPRPAFLPVMVPVAVWDILLLVILAALVWTAIGVTGKQLLQKLMPVATRLSTAGGQVALGFLAAVLLGGFVLLYLPVSRPEWVALLLR
jgi:hypothetical protein